MKWTSPRVIRGNRGDIASRYAILQQLLDLGVDIGSVFAEREDHVPPALRDRIVGYGPLYNFWPRACGIATLRKADAVVWAGGLDLQDDSSAIKLLHTWLVFLSYRLLGLKIFLAMQGAGPLTTGLGRWLARRVLSCVDLAVVRDRGSYALLAQLMKQDRLRLATDGIFLSGAPVTSTAAKPGGRRPTVGINLRLWFHFSGSLIPYQFARQRYAERARAPMEKLLSSMETVIRHLRAAHNARIILLSMYEPGVETWEDDQSLLDNLKARFAEDNEVACFRDDVSIADFFHVFKGLDLMIGMRLHSTLISLRCGTPAIHLAYTLKGADIYSDLGLKDWVVPVGDVLGNPASLIQKAEAILADSAADERTISASKNAVSTNDVALAMAVQKMNAR